MEHGLVIEKDVLDRLLATQCIMRYDQQEIDRSLTMKPVDCGAVKIHCPYACCDQALRRTWICNECGSSVEFCRVDDRLYCNCGGCKYDKWEFKCQDARHGSAWRKFSDSNYLLRLLSELKPFEQVNILILGETGVGKSTWINAFINYFTYDSFTEALESKDLKCIIPGSFTRQTSVYVVDIGENRRVRLIDTPGLGNRSEQEQDTRRKIEEMLRVLQTYEEIHGILILSKPVERPLPATLQDHVKQLLHPSASNNMVFGFTNTRESNFKPRDPLWDMGFKDSKRNLDDKQIVYSFDSESFIYLASQQKGIGMGDPDASRLSWEKSAEECKRLLAYFQKLEKPHKVQSTITRNEIRKFAPRLVERMESIARLIRVMTNDNDDGIKKLNEKILTRKQLEERLYIQEESLEFCPTEKPRTVCTKSECVEIRTDIEGRKGEAVVTYKTLCHNPCGLGESVIRDVTGHPGLAKCSEMDGTSGMCTVCKHSWEEHMHVYVDYKTKSIRRKDEAVNKQLEETCSDIELTEQAIEIRKKAVEDCKLEYQQIAKADQRFELFLRQNSMPVDDCFLHNIARSNMARITQMIIGKLAEVTGEVTEEDVTKLMAELYVIPHFSRDSKNIVRTNGRAAKATFRERSYSIQRSPKFSSEGKCSRWWLMPPFQNWFSLAVDLCLGQAQLTIAEL